MAEKKAIVESTENSGSVQSKEEGGNSTPLNEFTPVVIEWDIDKQEKYKGTSFVDWVAMHQLTGAPKMGDNFYRNRQTGQIKIIPGIQATTQGFPIIIYWEGKPLADINDKKRCYLDSSIWIRYADSQEQLSEIKAELQQYAKLYKTDNAVEVKEFKARMALNSFLLELDGSGHSQNVVPFVFHSETKMKRLTDSPECGVKSKIWQHPNAKKLKWRILIVDDNAFVADSTNTKSVNKCSVISSLLNRDFTVYCDNQTQQERDKCICVKKGVKCPCELYSEKSETEEAFYPNVYIDCARTISEAEDKIKHRRYDIVLLDYLFKEGTTFKGYGTELLKKLQIQYEDNIYRNDLFPEEVDLELYIQAKGPFGKLWIFFISAFSNAISEKMLSEGMHYNMEYWNVARGACPTTTPELFRYNLLSLMERQLKYITEVGGNDGKLNAITLIDYLSYLFEASENVRMKALDHFNSLLHLRARYDILKRDYYMGGKEKGKEAEANGSPLVQVLFVDMDCYSNAFWEHIQHLIYLIAYGNILQWNEMWDEYIFVRENLKRAENATGITNICKNIEEYIINIKSANFK